MPLFKNAICLSLSLKVSWLYVVVSVKIVGSALNLTTEPCSSFEHYPIISKGLTACPPFSNLIKYILL